MTTKILTLRIPTPVYSELCTSAAELGIPVSSHIRRLIEQEHQAEQVANLRTELLARLDRLFIKTPIGGGPSPILEEILLLSRATAAHLNPQLVAQVRARIASKRQEVNT